jgi:hypothetical protein
VAPDHPAHEGRLAGGAVSRHGFRHGAEALRQFCRIEMIVEDTPLLGRASGVIANYIGFPYIVPAH